SWARSISRVERNSRPALNVGMTTDTRWATATLPGRAGTQCGRGLAARPAPDAPIPQTGRGVPEGIELTRFAATAGSACASAPCGRGETGVGRRSPESLGYPCQPNLPDRLMNRRSRAREVALQLLFWRDHNPVADRT